MLPVEGKRMLNRITTAILVLELLAILVVFRFVTWRQLGKSFSVRARASRLVTTGVYARIRNPIYLAGILLVCGLALLVGHPWPLAILLVLIPVQRARARREAAVLHQRFGAEYERYRQQTWF